MTRLIDADALLEAVSKIYGRNNAPQGIVNLITNAPTVQRDENIIEIDKRDLFGFARSAIKDALTTDENMNEAHLWSDATDLTVKLLEKLQIPTVQREGWVSVHDDLPKDSKPVICSKARILAMILDGLMLIMTEDEIVELLKPKHIKGGIAILKNRNKE